MQIRFLHISDIHCGYNNYGVDQMRERLAPELLRFTREKGQKIDYLFITGDLRYGAAQGKGYPPETLSFIRELQATFGIEPEHTFVVPGNHDVRRGDMRTAAINGIKRDYRTHIGSISEDHLKLLDMTQEDYRQLYQQICGRSCLKNHFFVDLGSVNLIHLNTALICGSDGEDGSLIVGMSLLQEALQEMDTSKPAIVLAHHGIDCLTQEEQMRVERLLKGKNAIVYLCGHRHVNRFRAVAAEVRDMPLWELLCGTNMDQAPGVEQTEMSVYVGTLNPDDRCGYIDAYKWSRRNETWMPDSEFSYRERGATDGRFYFPSQQATLAAEADAHYLRYLRKTRTDIRLEGIPADDYTGTHRFPLETLYVPTRFLGEPSASRLGDLILHLDKTLSDKHPPAFSRRTASEKAGRNKKLHVEPFECSPHNVILAGPGGGKTTYLKKVISDHVRPGGCDGEERYPIWISCRTLNNRSDLSIMNIIRDLTGEAEFPLDEALRRAFGDSMSAKLLLGRAIVLIDGLDEISDTAKRDEFIRQLDTFSSSYPNNRILVTSRYAGYQDYKKSGLSGFDVLEIDRFSDEDIRNLCENWYRAVVNDTEEAVNEARALAEKIIRNDRIRDLAANPLLLTTLLLVQQRVGRLPTKRAALYEESIQVLLDSWNQGGHAAMELDKSVCKLAYIAYRMTCKGDKQATRKELLEYLRSARETLDRVLHEDTVSAEQFLMQVEQRSSILVRVGFKIDKETGILHDIYEFQHLTFQEYLTAVAVKEKYYPGATRRDQAIRILSDPDGLNAFDPEDIKKEVVLLTAALIGWDAEDIADHLIGLLQENLDDRRRFIPYADLAADLLLDDLGIGQAIKEELLQGLARYPVDMYSGLYASALRETAAEAALRNMDRWFEVHDLLDHLRAFSILPLWKLPDDSCRFLRDMVLSWEGDDRYLCHRVCLLFWISKKPPITDGLLEFLAIDPDASRMIIEGAANGPQITERDYFIELLRRLEAYRTLHPEACVPAEE